MIQAMQKFQKIIKLYLLLYLHVKGLLLMMTLPSKAGRYNYSLFTPRSLLMTIFAFFILMGKVKLLKACRYP